MNQKCAFVHDILAYESLKRTDPSVHQRSNNKVLILFSMSLRAKILSNPQIFHLAT